MFITLRYAWNNYYKTVKRGKPNTRSLLIFLKMVNVEIKCLLLTGYSIDEILK